MTTAVRLEGGRRRGHTALRALSTVLIVAGALLLIDAGLTLAWQEPVSALYAKLRQNALDSDLSRLETRRIARLQVKALERLTTQRRRLTFLARAERGRADPGDPLGRIQIPKIGANFVFVQGTDASQLRAGPGHYASTPLPGEPGTVGLAGHRTTFLAPFRDLDDLEPRDLVRLRMPYGDFDYAVGQTRIVAPDATWVLRRIGYDRLVLTACHPLYSADQRIVVDARLVRVTPRGRAKSLIASGAASNPSGHPSKTSG
jgi:sortase A